MDGLRILVGIDFSDGAARAVEEARRLAERVGAELLAVHVLQGYQGRAWQPVPEQLLWMEAQGLDPSAVVVRRGLPWVELVREAEYGSAWLIVVGSHGASGFQPVALGSTAARLAILSPYPVVLVGPRAVRWKGDRLEEPGFRLHET